MEFSDIESLKIFNVHDISAEDDFAALVQAATIRHALGKQSAACPSATRKI